MTDFDRQLRLVADALDPERKGDLWEDCPPLECGGTGGYVQVGITGKVHKWPCDNCHGTGRIPRHDLDALMLVARDAGWYLTVWAYSNGFAAHVMRYAPRDGHVSPSVATPLQAAVAALAAAMGVAP